MIDPSRYHETTGDTLNVGPAHVKPAGHYWHADSDHSFPPLNKRPSRWCRWWTRCLLGWVWVDIETVETAGVTDE